MQAFLFQFSARRAPTKALRPDGGVHTLRSCMIAKPWLKSKVGPPKAPIGSFGTGKRRWPHFGCGLCIIRQRGSGRGLSGLSRSLADLTAPPQQLRQLGDIGGDAPRLVASEQLGRRAPVGLVLEVEVTGAGSGSRQIASAATVSQEAMRASGRHLSRLHRRLLRAPRSADFALTT